MVAELLALVHVADVHLHHGAFDGADAVEQGYGRVGVGSRIEHDAVGGEANLLHLVDELALDVALIVAQFHFRKSPLEFWQVVLKLTLAVYPRLPHPQ